MYDRLGLVNTNQYQRISRQWQSVLEMGESVAVIFPYVSDKQIRFNQYLENFDQKDQVMIPIHLAIQSIDDINELKNYIKQQVPNYKEIKNVNLVIADGEELLKTKNIQVLDFLQRLMLDEPNIRLLSAFELNVFEKIPNFYQYNLLFPNIIYYPLYDNEDMLTFIACMCKTWNMKMPQPVRKSITYHSGGFFWLAKEACRIYRDTQKWSSDAPSFQFRLNSIAKLLSPEEKDIVVAAPHLKSFEKTIELKYLRKILLIKPDNSVSVPELAQKINENKKLVNLFESDGEDITLKGISLSKILSNTEYKILKYFVSQPGTPISRDDISKIIWPIDTEDHYSEWAIDQAIKRLRDRLISIKLSPTIIKSVRGVGYEFRT